MIKRNFIKDDRGLAAIEYAFLLPILIFLAFGIIECGIYFVKNQIATRAVSSTSYSIQVNPTHPDLETIAKQSGLSILDLNSNPNYICAYSYSDYNTAKSSLCTAGQWKTTPPTNNNDPYYVAVVAYSQQKTLTGLFDKILPDIRERTVVLINTNKNDVILGAKTVTYTPSGGQELTNNWQQANGMSIGYTPKSATSKIKVTFQYHASADYASDEGYFLTYATKLRLNGIDVPGKFNPIYEEAPGNTYQDTYYVNSWGTVPGTLSLMAKEDYYPVVLHRSALVGGFTYNGVPVTAYMEIIEYAQ